MTVSSFERSEVSAAGSAVTSDEASDVDSAIASVEGDCLVGVSKFLNPDSRPLNSGNDLFSDMITWLRVEWFQRFLYR